jgi:hypothetical protein
MIEGWWPRLLQGCSEDVVFPRGTFLFNYIYCVYIYVDEQCGWWMMNLLYIFMLMNFAIYRYFLPPASKIKVTRFVSMA